MKCPICKVEMEHQTNFVGHTLVEEKHECIDVDCGSYAAHFVTAAHEVGVKVAGTWKVWRWSYDGITAEEIERIRHERDEAIASEVERSRPGEQPADFAGNFEMQPFNAQLLGPPFDLGRNTCFDYVGRFVRRGNLRGVTVFVEPCGNITKWGHSHEAVLAWWKTVFETQPEDWDYCQAGWHLDDMRDELPDDPGDVWVMMK